MAKKKVVEILEFSSVQEAQATKEKCEKRLKNYPLARWIALAASVCGVIGGIAMIAGHGLQMLASPAVIGAIVTYVLIGGLGLGFKAAGRIAKTGWRLIPVFPIDMFFLVFAFLFAVYALFLIPIIILRSIRKQISADLQAAELYLKGHNAEKN